MKNIITAFAMSLIACSSLAQSTEIIDGRFEKKIRSVVPELIGSDVVDVSFSKPKDRGLKLYDWLSTKIGFIGLRDVRITTANNMELNCTVHSVDGSQFTLANCSIRKNLDNSNTTFYSDDNWNGL